MSVSPLAIIPLKDFGTAKRRLDLPDDRRGGLAQAVAGHVTRACAEAGLGVTIVTGSPAVRDWAREIGAEAVAEPPGGGLDGAAAAGVAVALDRPWLIVHGDLPLLSPADLIPVAEGLSAGRIVIAPARDGGTNLLGAVGSYRFRYGPGSFHRHLHAAAPAPVTVVVRAGTALEIDTIPDLEAAVRIPAGAWLSGFLS